MLGISNQLIISFIEAGIILGFTFNLISNKQLINTNNKILIFISAVILCTYLILTLLNSIPLVVALLQLKWLFYLMLFSIFKFPTFLKIDNLNTLLLFLVIYAYDYLVNNNPRPNFITENNFELLMVLILYILSLFKNKKQLFTSLTTFLIVIISGSKSAIFSFILITFIYFFKSNKKLFFTFLISFFSLIFFYFPQLNFDIQELDRFIMFKEWLSLIKEKTLLDLLLPNLFPQEVNLNLSNLTYYEDLEIEKKAYSTHFHLMNLRLIYDFGIIGFMFSYYFTYKVLTFFVEKHTSILILLLVFLNGMSVSGLNNSFWFFSLVILSQKKIYDKNIWL